MNPDDFPDDDEIDYDLCGYDYDLWRAEQDAARLDRDECVEYVPDPEIPF